MKTTNPAAAHTPGPWAIHPITGQIVGPRNANSIQRSIAYTPQDSPEDLANKALIASAPDLLAALEALANCPDYRGIATHEMTQARAAIARAKGL